MNWKDTLLAGGSRIPINYTGQAIPPGWTLDDFHKTLEASGAGPVLRNDWVAGPGGRPVISGSSESQVGAGAPAPVPSPGFDPVDAGQYGNNPYFAGRPTAPNASSSSAIVDAVLNAAQAQAQGQAPAVPYAGGFSPNNQAEITGRNVQPQAPATHPIGLDFFRKKFRPQSHVTPITQSLYGSGGGGETQRILGLGGF